MLCKASSTNQVVAHLLISDYDAWADEARDIAVQLLTPHDNMYGCSCVSCLFCSADYEACVVF